MSSARERAERSMIAGGLSAVTIERALACISVEGLRLVDETWIEESASLAVGDTVTTADELDRLPVGSAIRPNDGGVAERMASGSWWQTDVDGPRPVSRLIPARVLDLPEVTS